MKSGSVFGAVAALVDGVKARVYVCGICGRKCDEQVSGSISASGTRTLTFKPPQKWRPLSKNSAEWRCDRCVVEKKMKTNEKKEGES